MTTAPPSLTRIDVVREPPLARISLKNPPANVIDIAMMEELSLSLSDIAAQPEITTIVIRGDGKCFSAGVDIAAHAADQVGTMLQKFHGLIRLLVDSNKVTVALVHGSCLGGGAELAMLCDVVITSDEASWGFPEINLGCFPPVGVTALSALIGQKRATDLILTGANVLGSEAALIGLATRSVPFDKLDAALAELVEHLQKKSAAALAITKKSFYAWDAIHFDKGLAQAEKIYLEQLMNTEDAHEGVTAFLENREPKWKGR